EAGSKHEAPTENAILAEGITLRSDLPQDCAELDMPYFRIFPPNVESTSEGKSGLVSPSSRRERAGQLWLVPCPGVPPVRHARFHDLCRSRSSCRRGGPSAP